MRRESKLPDDWFQNYLDACIMVREFYVEERYPFIGSPPLARHELEKALGAIGAQEPLAAWPQSKTGPDGDEMTPSGPTP